MLEEDVRDDRYVVTVADECESAQTMKRACAKKKLYNAAYRVAKRTDGRTYVNNGGVGRQL